MPRNKKHSQKFSSKRNTLKKQQGRGGAKHDKKGAGLKTGPSTLSTHKGQATSKEKKLQQSISKRQVKMAAVAKEKAVGGPGSPPRIIGIVPVNESGDTSLVYRGIMKSCGVSTPSQPDTPLTLLHKEKKVRMTLVAETEGNEQEILDVAKVSDVLLLVADVSSAVQQLLKNNQQEGAGDKEKKVEGRKKLDVENDDGDDEEEEQEDEGYEPTWFSDIGLCITDMTRDVVRSLNAQGSPSIIVLLHGLGSYVSGRAKANAIRVHTRYFADVLCKETQVMVIDNDDDEVSGGGDNVLQTTADQTTMSKSMTSFDTLIRKIQTAKLRHLPWRDERPYLLAEAGDYNLEKKELVLSGYLRGNHLSANQLIHITNHGTYQVDRILSEPELCPFQYGSAGKQLTQRSTAILDVANEETQESLQCVQVNETLEEENEGWPQEEDVRLAQKQHQMGEETHKIRVPEGVSEYQAAWYANEEGVEVLGTDEDLGDDLFEKRSNFTTTTRGGDVEFLGVQDILQHEKMTDEQREAERKKLREQSQEDVDWPDEMETPFHLPARQRFAKYRGMKSFNNTKWNTKMNLPPEYARIYKLQQYQKIRSDVLSKKAQSEKPVEMGRFITIVLKNVEETFWKYTSKMIIASAQFLHEQKWSMLHFQVQRSGEFTDPIKSKSTMLAHIGFRKFYVAPLFSEVSVGDRTKYCRFFHEGVQFAYASFYGPITYHPAPILLFQAVSLEEEAEETPLRLCCYGSAAPPNPDFLLLKRATLTGRIATIYKKQVVVKYMFFNEEDVRWFQPLDLRTRLGRRGKITKPIGTHGLFKCQFNDQIWQHDVVCMDLYKRVFPKWNTVPYSIEEIMKEGETEEEDDE